MSEHEHEWTKWLGDPMRDIYVRECGICGHRQTFTAEELNGLTREGAEALGPDRGYPWPHD